MILTANKSFSVTSTAVLSFLASYNNSNAIQELNGVINGTSTVSPSVSVSADLLEFYICNNSGSSATVTFNLIVGQNTYTVFETTLANNYRIQYTQNNGFQVFDNYGR